MKRRTSLSLLAIALLGSSVVVHATEIALHNDIDGDGRSDLVWRNATTGAIVYWSGANAANSTSVVVNEARNLPADFTLGAMSLKGAYSEYGATRAQLLLMDKSGGYVALQFDYGRGHGFLAYPEMAYSPEWVLSGMADFGGDGDSEFVFRKSSQTLQRVIIQSSDNQQNRIRTSRSRFVNLILVKNKILPKHRQINPRLNLSQIVERS